MLAARSAEDGIGRADQVGADRQTEFDRDFRVAREQVNPPVFGKVGPIRRGNEAGNERTRCPGATTDILNRATDDQAEQSRVELRADVGGHPRRTSVGDAFTDELSLHTDGQAIGEPLGIADAHDRGRPLKDVATEAFAERIRFARALDVARVERIQIDADHAAQERNGERGIGLPDAKITIKFLTTGRCVKRFGDRCAGWIPVPAERSAHGGPHGTGHGTAAGANADVQKVCAARTLTIRCVLRRRKDATGTLSAERRSKNQGSGANGAESA